MKIEHICKAPIRGLTSHTDVEVRVANKELLNFWHNQVQLPFINSMDNRLDVGWNWPNKILLVQGTIARQLNQEPVCYTIGKKIGEGFLPLALIFLAEKYPAVFDKQKSSSFIWYLSTAPQDFLKLYLDENNMPNISELCLDVGITASYINGYNGIIGLHALNSKKKKKASKKLLNFYQNTCGLINLGSKEELPPGRKIFGNDGRYFYADEKKANLIRVANNIYR